MRYGCGKTDLRPHAVEIMKDRASSMERRSGRQASATDAGLTTTQPDTGTRVQAQLNPSSRDATQGPRSCGEAVRPWPIRKQGPYYRESWYRHVLRIPTVLHVFISRRVRQHTETFVINTVCIICRHNTADRSHFHESVLRKFRNSIWSIRRAETQTRAGHLSAHSQ